MRSWISICTGAALLAATSAIGNAAPAAPSPGPGVAQAVDVAPATDLSARRRADRHLRHHRRGYRTATRPAYYARPSDYRPDGMAPFFPFHYGYGLEPSW